MAFDSMGKGAAKGYQWLQEMRLKSAQLASSNAQAAQRAELQQQQMAQQERMQTERLDAAAAEREAGREMRREELGAQREEREAQMGERQRQFDLSRQDKLGQQEVENRRHATLDEWQMRLDEQKMQAEDARLAEIQERVAALQRQNDDAIRQDEEKRRLYEQVPMEALFSALNTKKPDGTSMGCNLPAVNAEIAQQLGLKAVDYSGFDQNGIFAIKGTDANGKQFVKQYAPEWVQGACEWFYGKDNPFGRQLGEQIKGNQEVATYGRKKAIDQENYERNKGEANLQSVLRSLSVEVGKGNMTQEEAEQAFAFYQQQAAKGAQGRGDASPAPQKGGVEVRDELAALIAERERRAAAKGGQRNIPGMPRQQPERPAPKETSAQGGEEDEVTYEEIQPDHETSAKNSELYRRYQKGEISYREFIKQTVPKYREVRRPRKQAEHPAPAPSPTQTQQQPAPQNEEVVSKPTTAEERKAAIAKIAKEYGIDPGQAERALNIATGRYNQDQRRGGKRSYDSFVTEQITWMMKRGQRTRGRTGRR